MDQVVGTSSISTFSGIVLLAAFLVGWAGAVEAQTPPILDVHLHAIPVASQGPPPMAMCTPWEEMPVSRSGQTVPPTFMTWMKEPACEDPIWSPETDDEVRDRTIAVMERLNVYGVLSGSPARVAEWSAAAPGRFIPGLGFRVGQGISPDSLRGLFESGRVEVLAEVTNQYLGIAPDDPSMDPYWALAEELDMPVGIHIGTGPPGVIYLGSPEYRARMHSPLDLEDVLARHPGLRVYVMHAGYPMLDDVLALMYAHPHVYLGVGVIVHTQPRPAFYRFLRNIVEAGFGKRVMFGSDQMVWPETIERGVNVILEADFLTDAQKRDILYNNAARFLDLSDEQMRAHGAR